MVKGKGTILNFVLIICTCDFVTSTFSSVGLLPQPGVQTANIPLESPSYDLPAFSGGTSLARRDPQPASPAPSRGRGAPRRIRLSRRATGVVSLKLGF